MGTKLSTGKLIKDALKDSISNCSKHWNYTEYILVVPHYLIDNYGSIYYVRYDIWSRLLILSDFDRKDKEFRQLGDVFRVNAILLALKFVASSGKSKFMICSDSLSCLVAIESCKTQNPFISKIVHIYNGENRPGGATLSPSLESSVSIAEYSDVIDLITAKCC
jgi:hypothetical protein